ncbi:hypothetical protein BC629DRAFT_676062 [Irpex lacteus]|nr:hypothetical protein BC629DRAFT_676062 [Irpex lacteus]
MDSTRRVLTVRSCYPLCSPIRVTGGEEVLVGVGTVEVATSLLTCRCYQHTHGPIKSVCKRYERAKENVRRVFEGQSAFNPSIGFAYAHLNPRYRGILSHVYQYRKVLGLCQLLSFPIQLCTELLLPNKKEKQLQSATYLELSQATAQNTQSSIP